MVRREIKNTDFHFTKQREMIKISNWLGTPNKTLGHVLGRSDSASWEWNWYWVSPPPGRQDDRDLTGRTFTIPINWFKLIKIWQDCSLVSFLTSQWAGTQQNAGAGSQDYFSLCSPLDLLLEPGWICLHVSSVATRLSSLQIDLPKW